MPVINEPSKKPSAKDLARRLETIRIDFEQELGDFRAREEEAAARIDRLKRMLLTREAALRGSAEQNQRFESILSELRTDLSALRVKAKSNLARPATGARAPELDSWRLLEAESEIKRLQNALDARNRAPSEAQDDIRRIDAALQRALSELRQAQTSDSNNRSQANAARAERDSLAEQVTDLQRSVEETAAQLIELRSAGQHAAAKAAEEEAKRTAAEGRAEEIQQQFQELFARYERETHSLRDERQTFQSQIERLEDELISKTDEQRAFAAEVDALRKDLAARQEALDQSESRAAALEAKDRERDGDVRTIHDDIAAGNQRLEEEVRAKVQLENDLLRLREEFESVAELVSHAEQRREALEREITGRDTEIASLRRRAVETDARFADEILCLRASLAEKEEALGESDARHERLARESEQLAARAAGLESRVQELLNESSAKEELLRSVRDTTDEHFGELESLRHERDSLLRRTNEHEKRSALDALDAQQKAEIRDALAREVSMARQLAALEAAAARDSAASSAKFEAAIETSESALRAANTENEALRATTADLEHRVVGLTGDVFELRAERENLSATLGDVIRLRDESARELGSARDHLRDAGERETGLHVALSLAESRLAQANDALFASAAREEFAAARVEAAGRALAELHAQLLALTERTAQLEAVSDQLSEMQRGVESFRENETRLAGEIACLTSELQQASGIAAAMTAERNALNADNGALKGQVGALEHELITAGAAARELSARSRDLAERGEILTADLAAMTAERDASLRQAATLEAERDERDIELQANEAERARLSTELLRIESARAELSRELEHAKQTLSERENDLVLAATRSEQLQTSLNDTISELTIRERAEHALAHQAELLQQEIALLGDTVVAIQLDLARRESELGAAKAEADDARKKFGSARAEWADREQTLHGKLAALNSDVDELHTQLTATEGKLGQWRLKHAATDAEARARAASLTQEIARREEELQRRDAAIQSLEQQLATLAAAMEDIRRTLASVTQEKDELARLRDSLAAELTGLGEQLDALTTRLDETEGSRKEIEGKLSGVRESLRGAEQREEDARVRISALDAARTSLEAEKVVALSKIAELSGELGERDKTIAARDEDIETLKGERALAHQSMKDLGKQIAALREDLEGAEDHLAEADKRIAELQSLRNEAEKQERDARFEMKRMQELTRRAEEELRDIKEIELPKALEQKVRAFRETQELRQEVELLRRQVW